MRRVLRWALIPIAIIGAWATYALSTPEPSVGLYFYFTGDPTTGAGQSAPMWQLGVRTDSPVTLYYKCGAANTAWCAIAGGGGAGVTGTGTPGTLPVWLTSTSLSNSSVTDNGTTVATSEAVSLGSLSPLHNTSINGELLGVWASFQNANQNAPTVSATNTTTGETSGKIGIQSSVSGSVNTTAGALTSYGVEATNTATRSAGANNATNIGVYASAGGAQVNQAIYADQGDVFFNNASNGSNTFEGPTTINNRLSTEELDLPSFITATNLTGGTVNNWDPTGGSPGNLDDIERVNVAPTANTTVTGLIIGDSGQVLSIHNTSTSFSITFTNQGAGSTAANRFTWPNAGNYELVPGAAVTIRTSQSVSGWNPWSSGTQNQALTSGDLVAATDTNQIGNETGGTNGDLTVWTGSGSIGNFAGTTNGQAPVWNGSTWIADDDCDDPTLRYCMIEEFENINTSCTTLGAKIIGSAGSGGGTGQGCSNSGFEGHPGVLVMTTGTGSAGVAYGRSAPNGAIVFGGGFGEICNTMLLYIPVLSTTATKYIVRDGFQDQFGSGQATNGVEVIYDQAANDGGDGGNFWALETSQASTHTVSTCDGTGGTTSEAVTAATWTLTEVCVDAEAANAYLYINGTLCTTVTTNIPSGTSHLDSFGLQIQNLEGTGPISQSQYIDFMKVTLPFTVAR